MFRFWSAKKVMAKKVRNNIYVSIWLKTEAFAKLDQLASSALLKRPTDQVGENFLFLVIIYTLILLWTFLAKKLILDILLVNLQFKGPHTRSDHQLRFRRTSDPIEIEVNHFWQDDDPPPHPPTQYIHKFTCDSRWLYTSMVRVWGLNTMCPLPTWKPPPPCKWGFVPASP